MTTETTHIDATMEREIGELYDALVDICASPERLAWARQHPDIAAATVGMVGRVRWAFLFALTGDARYLLGEEARAPAVHYKRGFWWD